MRLSLARRQLQIAQIGSKRYFSQLKVVTDASHPQLRHAVLLYQDKALRHRQGRIVVNSNRLIDQYRRSGFKLISYLHTPQVMLSQLPLSFAKAVAKHPRVCVSEELLSMFTNRLSLPDGVAVLERDCKPSSDPSFRPSHLTSKLDTLPKLDDQSERHPIIVVLDALRDPGNVGSIIRTAAAFDLAGVVLLGSGCDAWSSHCLSSSAGTHTQVPIAHYRSLDDLVASLQNQTEAGINALLMTSTSNPDTPCEDLFLHAWQWHKVNLLVLGSEQAGLSTSTVEAACLQADDAVTQRLLSLPMAPGVESLNVGHAMSMAVAVAMTKL
eukprot:m.105168 g.105168  ORF g.105168 m.105168 type:complete len:325 (-) comp15273_c1_seq1:140-1114(-)